ncbi:MAG: hypothetical protein ACFFD4_22120 [Candidatus Odinarchaeota archaeon]
MKKDKNVQFRISEREAVEIDNLCQQFDPPLSKSDLFRLSLDLLKLKVQSREIKHDGNLDKVLRELGRVRDGQTVEGSLKKLGQQVTSMHDMLVELAEKLIGAKEESELERLKKEILSKEPSTVRELTQIVDFQSLDAVISVLKELNAAGKIVYEPDTGNIDYK